MANVIKDIGEIWTRLFDHRPFLNGEIRFFLHEFEEKRDNREVEALFQILQNLTEIRYTQTDKIKLGADAHLPALKTKIDDSVTICKRIIEKEELHKADATLEKKRELRKAEWEIFIQDIAKKCEKVDKAFKEKEYDLHDYYFDLEKKLHISPNHYKNITTIKDPTVHLRPSDKLLQFLQENSKGINKNKSKVPDNIKSLIKNKKTLLKESDIEWLNNYLIKEREIDVSELLSGNDLDCEIEKILQKDYSNFACNGYLDEKNKNLPYLHDLMKGSELVLPKNEVIKRNPVLAERIEKLKKEQEEREYKEMTKNVDLTKKHHAEDTISYQMNMMNRHLIAVAQFLVSVGAGFAFGFLGVELIIGDINFGVRLILGITCALIIALAEFYFLAKHLNEEEKEVATEKPPTSKVKTKAKPHKD